LAAAHFDGVDKQAFCVGILIGARSSDIQGLVKERIRLVLARLRVLVPKFRFFAQPTNDSGPARHGRLRAYGAQSLTICDTPADLVGKTWQDSCARCPSRWIVGLRWLPAREDAKKRR